MGVLGLAAGLVMAGWGVFVASGDRSPRSLILGPVSRTNGLRSTLVALSAQQINSSSNPLASAGPFSLQWVANPRLSWTDKFAIFRTDGQARPFIFQEELPVQVTALAEGSELEACQLLGQTLCRATMPTVEP